MEPLRQQVMMIPAKLNHVEVPNTGAATMESLRQQVMMIPARNHVTV
jgi:hypothetical protein